MEREFQSRRSESDLSRGEGEQKNRFPPICSNKQSAFCNDFNNTRHNEFPIPKIPPPPPPSSLYPINYID